MDKRYPNHLESIVIEEAMNRFKARYYAKKALNAAEWKVNAMNSALEHDAFLKAEVDKRCADWQRWEDQGLSPL